MFYTQPSKSGCILPSQQVLIWAGLISDAQLELLEASVVGGAALQIMESLWYFRILFLYDLLPED